MASYPIDLQPPNMVVSEEKVLVADHYNIRAESTKHRHRCFSGAVDTRNNDTMEEWSGNVG